MQIVSLSDTMDIRTPWKFTISFVKCLKNIFRKSISQISKNCIDFMSLSTITQTPSSFWVWWSFNTSSIVMICSHFHSRIGRGCKNFEGFCLSTFIYFQTKHLATYLAISFFMGTNIILVKCTMYLSTTGTYMCFIKNLFLKLFIHRNTKPSFHKQCFIIFNREIHPWSFRGSWNWASQILLINIDRTQKLA